MIELSHNAFPLGNAYRNNEGIFYDDRAFKKDEAEKQERLRKAAPDMLEASVRAVRSLELMEMKLGITPDGLNELKAAIAKAKGETE